MRCLTLRQPWAYFLLRGMRTCEYRNFTISNGPLLIHAAVTCDEDYERHWYCDYLGLDPFRGGMLYERALRGMTRGAIVALALVLGTHQVPLGDPLRSFGRLRHDLFVREVLAEPVPVTGRLGIWSYHGDLPLSPDARLLLASEL